MGLARKFLWAVAAIVILVFLGAIVWRLAGDRLMRVAFVPSISFAESPLAPAPDYQRAESWLSRPGKADDPARWAPSGYTAAPRPAAHAFFVAPTAYLGRDRWNAPLSDSEMDERLAEFLKGQASTLNGVAAVWAPRYRQATFGAFLTDKPEAQQALDLAFADVDRAFRAFLADVPADAPLILAGHSQGARHVLQLLRQHRQALEGRLVVAYAPGWPLALPDDLRTVGVPACEKAGQSGCVASWQSWAADGDMARALDRLGRVPDLEGVPLGARPMLCTNPLTGGDGKAGMARNMGTMVDDELKPKMVGAGCHERGLLLIAPKPEGLSQYVMPGGNYHVYDVQLFWANVRADVEARLSDYGASRLGMTLGMTLGRAEGESR